MLIVSNLFFMIQEKNGAIILEPKMEESGSGIPNLTYNIQISLPNIEAYIKESKRQTEMLEKRQTIIENQFETFMRSMSNLSSFLFDKLSKGESVDIPAIEQVEIEEMKCKSGISVKSYQLKRERWKEEVHSLITRVLQRSTEFPSRKDVYNHLYETVRREYGIVWEQLQKETQWKHGLDKRPRKLDACYEDENARSIFRNKLEDLVWLLEKSEDKKAETPFVTIGDLIPMEKKVEIQEAMKVSNDEVRNRIKHVQELVAPLLEKREDTSVNGVTTYRVLYKHMATNYGVNWKEKEVEHIELYGKRVLKKINAIAANDELFQLLLKSISELS